MSKILIVGLNFHPELTGVGKYTGELAAYLARQGHQVRVITTPPYYPHWHIQGGYRAWRYQKETWQGVEIQRCPLWVPRHPTGITRLIHLATFAFSSQPALIAKLRWKPAIVLCIAPAFFCAPFAWFTARLSGAKAWLHVHDFELDVATNLEMLPRFLIKTAARWESWMLSRFDRVSTISENMRLLCIEKGVKPERAFLLPNWVDTEKIYPLSMPSPLRVKLNITSQTFIALYHGNMGCKQGLKLLLETARLLGSDPRILIVLCGEGPAKKELVEQAASLPNVRFLDLQPEEKLNELVNLADAHLLPQLANAADLVMPSKLSGMLASGKAVIATANPDTEVGQAMSKIGILIPPEDPVALAEAILRLARSLVERSELGKKGREFAVSNLDAGMILGQFEQRLQEMAEKDNAGDLLQTAPTRSPIPEYNKPISFWENVWKTILHRIQKLLKS